jgi:Zn-dependent protease
MEYRIPKNGYIVRFSIRDVPIHIHWTFPIGGVFIAFFLGNPTLVRSLLLVAAYTIMIIVHELGHAMAAKIYSSKVHCILVTGSGGWCFAEEPKSFSSRMVFYAGGIMAQLLLLLVVTFYVAVFGSPESRILSPFVFVFTLVNAFIIVVNLIPAGKNDGMRLLAALKEKLNA